MLPQNNYGGYQPTDAEREEQERNALLELTAIGALGAGAGATAIFGETERRKRAGSKTPLKDLKTDAKTAFEVLRGSSAYDEINTDRSSTTKQRNGLNDPNQYRSIRNYAESATPDSYYSVAGPDDVRAKGYVKNPLTQMAVAARDAFNPSSEDFLAADRSFRESIGLSAEGPRSDVAFQRMPLVDGVRDLFAGKPGGFNEDRMASRRAEGIDLMKANSAQAAGSLLGRTASDFVNNGARSFWWLVNAPQAVSDLASEGTAGAFNRYGLYGVDIKNYDDARQAGWVDTEGNPENSSISDKSSYKKSKDPYLQQQYQEQVGNLENDTGKQYISGKRKRIYGKRRTGNNLSTLMALPAAVGINAGLGLVNPAGGSDGYKAVLPSEDDPTKTRNVLGEIASKYILGRRGDILPWDEFRKVRPDVTKDEYMRYKAYKYNKGTDLNPFDGDWNLGGILKGTDDGIEGGEVMFLGKHMPTDTVLLPTAAAVLGSAVGAALGKHGGLTPEGLGEGIQRRSAYRDALEAKAAAEGRELSPNELNRINKDKVQISNAEKRVGRASKVMDYIPGIRNRTNRNRRLHGRSPVTTGLVGGGISLALASLIGHENERRRREREIQENQF